MYNLIVIDDERFVLNILPDFVNYEEFNIKFCKAFTNAEDAIRYVNANHVDLVICDIKLQGMSGLDFAKYIYENHPNIKVIMLSAYHKFDYAQKSFKYEAVDYIIKPILLDDYISALKKAVKFLDNFAHRELSSFLSENKVHFIQTSLSNYISGNGDIGILTTELAKVGVEINYNYPCMVVNLKIINIESYMVNIWSHSLDRLYLAIRNVIPSSSDNKYIFFLNTLFDNIHILLISMDSEPHNIETINDFFCGITAELKENFNLDSQFSIVDSAESLSELRIHLLYSHQISVQTGSVVKAMTDDNIGLAIKICDDTVLANDLDYCLYFYNNLKTALKSEFVLAYDKNEETDFQTDITKDCISAKTKELINLYWTVMSSNTTSYSAVTTSIQYINEHYMEDITLNSVANAVHLSPSYFSKSFLKITGVKFAAYLSSVRISKAKELIEENTAITLQELCDKTGFKSIPHFYKMFEKNAGVTLMQYRQDKKNNT